MSAMASPRHFLDLDQFDTGTLRKGERKVVPFPNAGAFPYLCKFHRHMTGRVVVT